jgi:hypothetical protein
VLEHGAQALLEKESLGEKELMALRAELGALPALPTADVSVTEA